MMPTHTLIQASEALTLAAQQPLLWLDARFELGQPQQGAADFAGGHVAGALRRFGLLVFRGHRTYLLHRAAGHGFQLITCAASPPEPLTW